MGVYAVIEWALEIYTISMCVLLALIAAGVITIGVRLYMRWND